MKGKTYDEIYGSERAAEIRRNQSESQKGEQNSNYGKHPSEETRRKMSKARKKWWARWRIQQKEEDEQ